MTEKDAIIAELQLRAQVKVDPSTVQQTAGMSMATPPPKNPGKAKLDHMLENIMFELTPSDQNGSGNVSVNSTPEKAEAAPTVTYTNTSYVPTLQLQGTHSRPFANGGSNNAGNGKNSGGNNGGTKESQEGIKGHQEEEILEEMMMMKKTRIMG